MLLLPMEADNLVPTGNPTTITDQVAQGEQWVNMLGCPTHTSLFEPAMNDHFMTALHGARPNGESTVLEMWIINEQQSFLKIEESLVQDRRLLVRELALSKQAQVSQSASRRLVLELVADDLKPLLKGRRTFAE